MRQHAQAQDIGNAVIINTCAVTNEAERQSRQAVRKARRDFPGSKIIVAGCSAQLNPKTYGDMPEVDLVLGNHEKMQQESFAPGLQEKVRVNDILEIKETAHHLVSGFENHVRAFIQIQNGCDHRCTFCSIPLGRGNNRSVPMPEIIHQVAHLMENGCHEVVLTGVDITGYGGDLPGQPALGQLCKRILTQVPELKRLRLSSLDPVEVDADLFRLIAEEPKMMPHFHISMQAGDDMILKRMKRRHLRQDIYDFCAKVRDLRPGVVFGADVIAGFPTETDEMFQRTYDCIQDNDITYLHVFPYSARKNTPAARMPQVAKPLIKERAGRLRDLGTTLRSRYFQSLIGQEMTVVTELGNKAHGENFAPIRIESTQEIAPGTFRTLKITGTTEQHLIAHI